MLDADVAWYRRLLEEAPDMSELLRWTVVQPLTGPVTVADAVRRLGADPAGIETRTGRDDDDLPVVHLHQAGPAVLLVETFEAQGVREEVLRWLSDGAVVHGSWWADANGRSLLCYAAFGRLLTRLEYLDDQQPGGEQPTALDEDRAALRDLSGDLDHPAQLALVERRTGVRLDTAWLGRPHPTVVLDDPIPDDPRPPGMLAAADPDLAAVFLMADEPTRRTVLHRLLGRLADEQDLRSEPLIGAVLDAFADGRPPGDTLARDSHAMKLRLAQELDAAPGGSPERTRRYHRMRAAEAFAAAVGDRTESVDTLWYAQQAMQERWPRIRTELWRAMRGQATL
ncbi:hypothetical protein [Actinomadura sp. 21ATH]|uniref:hypothetical protein n=1 Tax=Actinomadura sp. 21ATH TaxID=1735444 RepID=UPI0035C08312